MVKSRAEIEATGTQVAFVHLGTEEDALPIFRKYGLEDVARISDPEAKLYDAFGLAKGRASQFMGPKAILRGTWTALFAGHGFGRIIGDHTRMPGVFLLHEGKVLREFRHRSSADRPDYRALGGLRAV